MISFDIILTIALTGLTATRYFRKLRPVFELTIGCYLLRDRLLLFSILAIYHWTCALYHERLHSSYRERHILPHKNIIYVIERFLYLMFFLKFNTFTPIYHMFTPIYPVTLLFLTVMNFTISTVECTTGYCLLAAMNMIE